MSNEIKIIDDTIKQEKGVVLDLDTASLGDIEKKLLALDNQANIIRDSLQDGIQLDYAVIPGCGTKPSLLLPGARKIALMFGLRTSYEIVEKKVDDLKVRYVIKASLTTKDGMVISESFGGANNLESKSKTMNENSILKIAQKRAFIGAILQVSNLSKLFTQDVEDMDKKERNSGNVVARKQASEEDKKERFGIYNLIKINSPKMTQEGVKNKVKELIGAFNTSHGTEYRSVFDFTPEHFDKLVKTSGYGKEMHSYVEGKE